MSDAKGGEKVRKGKLAGKRLEIFWPRDRKWFAGTAVLYDPEEDLYRIDYDDGEKEVVDIEEETWRFEDPDKTKRRLSALRAKEERERKKALAAKPRDPPAERKPPPQPAPRASTRTAARVEVSSSSSSSDGDEDGAAADGGRAGRHDAEEEEEEELPPRKRAAPAPSRKAAPPTKKLPLPMGNNSKERGSVVDRLNTDVTFLKNALLEVRDSIAIDQRKASEEYQTLGQKTEHIETSVRNQIKEAKDYYDTAVKLTEANEKGAKQREKKVLDQLKSVSDLAESWQAKFVAAVAKFEGQQRDIERLSAEVHRLRERVRQATRDPGLSPGLRNSTASAPPTPGDAAKTKAWLLEAIATFTNVWLLENDHETKAPIMQWSNETTAKCFNGVKGYLARYNSLEVAKASFEEAAERMKVNEIEWLTNPSADESYVKVRKNYHLWNPVPSDDEWTCEQVLLTELRLRIGAAVANRPEKDNWTLQQTLQTIEEAQGLVLTAPDQARLTAVSDKAVIAKGN